MTYIELAKNLIESLPKPQNKGYVLCDSWYSCKDIFNSSKKAGFSYIGVLKTYEAATNGISINEIFEILKLA